MLGKSTIVHSFYIFAVFACDYVQICHHRITSHLFLQKKSCARTDLRGQCFCWGSYGRWYHSRAGLADDC
jgi:hypothetical protein